MSEAMINRWKSIPMERPGQSAGAKRTRDNSSEDGSGSDDNVSLVSRSPSPAPTSAQEALRQGIDSYANGTSIEEEIATLETKIKKTNIGYSMLSKLGWKEGQGLGAHGTGRPEPIPFVIKNDQTGLGKASLDSAMIDATVAQRRDLASERQTRETEEQRLNREEGVAKQAAIREEITGVLKPFYCDLCDKQYLNVGQYDEHCNSYAHHHMVRMKDLKASAKLGNDTASRMMKERKREERDLRKIAKAAGIKLIPARAGMVSPPSNITPPIPPTLDAPKKSSGWAAVGSSGFAPVSSTAASTSKSGGWNRVGASTSEPAPPAPGDAPPPPPPGPPPPLPSSAPPPPDTSTTRIKPAPVFHSSGRINLTHQLEERAIVDTNVDDAPSSSKDQDHEMQESVLAPHFESPKRMVIDVDEMYPPTPGTEAIDSPAFGTPAFGRHLPKTPAWRIHEAPSPSPHIGATMQRGPFMDQASPIATSLRGGGGFRGRGFDRGGGIGGVGRGQGIRSFSPILDLSGPPGWSKPN